MNVQLNSREYNQLAGHVGSWGCQQMRLWTVQGEQHWLRCREQGRLTGGTGGHIDAAWKPAYDWMRDEMAMRVPGFSGEYPVWAWVESPVGRLRHAGGWGNIGERMVLLVLDVPHTRVLRSSFHAWHAVLNDTPVNIDDDGEPIEGVDKRASWQRIFDLMDPVTRLWGDHCAQACVDGVDLRTELVAVLPFEILST